LSTNKSYTYEDIDTFNKINRPVYSNLKLNTRYSLNTTELKQVSVEYNDKKKLISNDYNYKSRKDELFAENNIFVLKRFDFDSNLSRMSIISRDNMSEFKTRV